jgi:thioredoxin reductase (NADPH)
MFDHDVIIVGGGPAGLTAGIYLSRARYRVLVLEKENFGGQLKNIEWIENYPGFTDGIAGPRLGTEMMNQALKYGTELKQGEVTGIESFSNTKYLNCSDGKGYTCAAVIIAGGAKPRKLGIPGEDAFRDKGLIHCALCDGGRFSERTIAVCGGGDAGITEALYLSKIASKVIVIEAMPKLTASAILQERTIAEPKIEIRCGERAVKIAGRSEIEEIETEQTATGKKEILKVNGVLVHVGIDPNTDYLDGIIPLDETGQVMVSNKLETEVASIYAAGDIRKDSPRQVAAAVGDGTIAAITAQRFLQSIGTS